MDFSFWHSVLLGVIQGLSEFLPISSSGHLVVLPWLLEFPDPGLAFNVALHAGTLVAVVSFFWKDWLNIFGLSHSLPEYEGRRSRMLGLLALGSVPGALAGYYFEDLAATVFRHPILVAATLAIFGYFLYWADRQARSDRRLGDVGWRGALLVGLAQALAIVPGVSRSGSTITAGLLLGLDRVSAARFSFLLATPIIFGATLVESPYLIGEIGNAVLWAGILAAAGSGYLAIKYLIRFVSQVSYRIFFWYRLALSALIVTLYLAR